MAGRSPMRRLKACAPDAREAPGLLDKHRTTPVDLLSYVPVVGTFGDCSPLNRL